MKYQFIDNQGTFRLDNPEMSSYMYFPLCNDAGVKTAITPELAGDMKMDQNTFALQPVSSEELHNSRSTRNFWVKADDQLWSLTGQSSAQHMLKGTLDKEETNLEAGFLYQKMTRKSHALGLAVEVTSYVPNTEDTVELTAFVLSNIGDTTKTIEGTSAIPLYGRSADNYRDHRHVTSLLGQAMTTEDGMWLKPTLSFDERGHQVNEKVYGVVANAYRKDGSSVDMIGVIPTVEDFIGEGGSQAWPITLFDRENSVQAIGTATEGYEIMAGLCFEAIELAPGESVTFNLGIFIADSKEVMPKLKEAYLVPQAFEAGLKATKQHWVDKTGVITMTSADHAFDQWMRWVNIQPILRRIFGCSFLPHHDYGRGGRGWRDLWQDCLALLLMEPEDVRFLLLNNFAGVRMDGSNATIIGTEPGEFLADRNGIPRTWMDHGAWPWLTTKEYIHQSGDIDFLFEEQTYFKDGLMDRAKAIDEAWDDNYGGQLRAEDDSIYKGTLLEHLLVQNLSAFYNVGEHNILRLEGADWNDALDMAEERGESVAFSALYTSNLRDIAKLIREVGAIKDIEEIELAKELLMLLGSLDYESIEAKTTRLEAYFRQVDHKVSGEKVMVAIEEIASLLEEKVAWFEAHIQKQEFISDDEGNKWFNSYYDDNGRPVEGPHDNGTRVMLTGQVFTLMGDVATDDQSKEVVKACKHFLQDASVGGYRLNTDFKEVKHDLGRGFGFAYGHKENGAMFSHMAIMYGNALYRRGFIEEGYELIHDMFSHCNDFDKARIYPSVPEYINEGGRGMYTYLTGSASWLIYTAVTEMFGCQGHYGDLKLVPKLHPSQFKDGLAEITFLYRNRPLTIRYKLEGRPVKTIKGYEVTGLSPSVMAIESFKDQGLTILPFKAVHEIQESQGILEVSLRAL